uniref:Uncharacterized protein n=1 Tax=Glossina palpalis gambiensis TaxID=67801 RepID=A0A1B0AT23_9MUSC
MMQIESRFNNHECVAVVSSYILMPFAAVVCTIANFTSSLMTSWVVCIYVKMYAILMFTYLTKKTTITHMLIELNHTSAIGPYYGIEAYNFLCEQTI